MTLFRRPFPGQERPERAVSPSLVKSAGNGRLVCNHLVSRPAINHEINPADYWDDNIDMRENNERMQRLTEMNTLCKPVYEIIERNEWFFKRLKPIKDIHILGHSCEAVDYPYFRKVKESAAREAKWLFYPFTDEDRIRFKRLISEIAILNY